MTKSRKVDERPAFMFYVKDWLSDFELQSCGYTAQGVWINLLCYMWITNERGMLSKSKAQNAIKMSTNEFEKIIKELVDSGACDIDEKNNIICRKMREQHLKEKHISDIRRMARLGTNAPQKGGFSSSFSSSSSKKEKYIKEKRGSPPPPELMKMVKSIGKKMPHVG